MIVMYIYESKDFYYSCVCMFVYLGVFHFHILTYSVVNTSVLAQWSILIPVSIIIQIWTVLLNWLVMVECLVYLMKLLIFVSDNSLTWFVSMCIHVVIVQQKYYSQCVLITVLKWLKCVNLDLILWLLLIL